MHPCKKTKQKTPGHWRRNDSQLYIFANHITIWDLNFNLIMGHTTYVRYKVCVNSWPRLNQGWLVCLQFLAPKGLKRLHDMQVCMYLSHVYPKTLLKPSSQCFSLITILNLLKKKKITNNVQQFKSFLISWNIYIFKIYFKIYIQNVPNILLH